MSEVWAAAGLVSCLLLSLLSYLPFVAPVPFPVPLLFLAGLFPVAITAIITGRSDDNDDALADRPWWSLSRTWPLVPVAFAVIGFLTALSGLPGQPEVHGGLYYFNSHGTLIPTDAEGYRHGLQLVQRIFTSVPAFLYTVALVMLRSSRQS